MIKYLVQWLTLWAMRGMADDTCSNTQQTSGTLAWRSQPYPQPGRKPWTGGPYGGTYVADAFARRFQKHVTDNNWDVLWTHRAQHAGLRTESFSEKPRLMSHCNFFVAAGNKCTLSRYIKQLRQIADVPDRHLQAFELSDTTEFALWRAALVADPSKHWIAKECTAGASAGISLLHATDLLANEAALLQWKGKGVVAQEYISRPFAGFGGRKFHIRMYVLVTAWGPPASVFLYDDGLVFLSQHTIDGRKPSAEKDVFSRMSADVDGFHVADLWAAIDNHPQSEVNSSEVYNRIRATIGDIYGPRLFDHFGDPKTKNVRADGITCFDLFGLDVMLDEKLKPFVLELNTGPNMEISDHDPRQNRLLESIKRPFMEQLVDWMALAIGNSSQCRSDASPEQALRNFTRIL